MANGQTTTRRGILKAAPAVMVVGAGAAAAQAAALEDPILPIYREWREARAGWTRLVDQDVKNEGSPQVRALMAVEDDAFWAMTEMTPTSMAGIVALTRLLWDVVGPQMREGTGPYLEELQLPENLMLAAIWRSASGKPGLPVD